MFFSKISLIQALATLPLLIAGAALPINNTLEAKSKANCVVNARQRDLWVENGLSRWRTVFSAEGTNPAAFCKYWEGDFWTNLQCGWSANIDGGTWFVDGSGARGPAGDAWYWFRLKANRDNWIADTGCRTG
ncbi:hypothetical protein CC86DRAFT_405865 [Ophiobolus disseminans]|uniref:Uncharacterized protein n=1 Tax=Ophiobolus disseminans TaxID=1469910 RepID=A0A6A7A1L7_9PLEO|nr:hypothetical protein CC86DRAFT_405865 [Ophiobolus disseminans]